MDYKILNCENGDENYICDRLVEYNLSQVPKTQKIEFENINIKAVDQNQNIIGGCVAKMYCWNVVYVDILWVDENFRNNGIGIKLLQEVEKIAVKKKCNLIHLDTFDFQAKDFYSKLGYEIFGVLEDCPPGHCRYYMKKVFK